MLIHRMDSDKVGGVRLNHEDGFWGVKGVEVPP